MVNIETYRKYTYDGEMQVAGHFGKEEKDQLEREGYKLCKNSKNKTRQPVNKNGILITS